MLHSLCDQARLQIILKTANEDIFRRTKAAIIKTIEQELWPLEGQFDEIDNLIEEFERKIRAVVSQ